MDSVIEVLKTAQEYFAFDITIPAAIIVYILLWFSGRLPAGDGRLNEYKLYKQWIPFLPLPMGVVAMALPIAERLEAMPMGQRLMLGVWVGFVAAHGRKILKRWFFEKIEGKTFRKSIAPKPESEPKK